MKESNCLVCWSLAHDISQAMLIEEFGTVKIWAEQAKHDKEAHEKPEVPAE